MKIYGNKGNHYHSGVRRQNAQELCQQLLEEGYRIVYEEDRRAGSQIEIGTDCILEVDNHCIRRGRKKIHLTPNEYKILYTMVKSPHRVYSRNQLITYALEDAFDGYDRTIDSYIKSIRKKIEKNPRRPQYIITVHGVGYKYVPSDSEVSYEQ